MCNNGVHVKYFFKEKEVYRLELYHRQTSLRDIKKEKTANDIAEAAFELALERGLDGFVVEDIVQRAGYSRRTFANYFSCKEEAVVTIALNQKGVSKVEHFISEISENMPPIDILYHLLKTQFTTNLLKKLRKLVSLSKQHPTLEPYILSVLQHFQEEAVKVVRHLSHERYPDEYPYQLVGSVYGAVLPLLDGGLNILFPDQSTDEFSGSMTFEQYLDTTFNYLRNGF